MSIQVYQESYTEEDYTKYQERIREQLDVLRDLIRMPGFGGDNYRFAGAIDYYLTDENANVAAINKDLVVQAGDPRITLALNKYHIDLEFSPVQTGGLPFDSLYQELIEVQELIDESAAQLKCHATPIGILPTLKREDLCAANMTEICRNKALNQGLEKLRGKNIRIHIEGNDPLMFNCNDVSLEGANSALHFYLKTPVKRFAKTWNALQLITPIVMGVSANSPVMFGHRLWQETRVAMFKKTSNGALRNNRLWQKPPRTNYGQGWLRKGPWELFSENVALYDPVLPVVYPKDALDSLRAGEVPTLDELRLHQSTITTWNRAIFDTAMNGHFQIESRCLPAGPSNLDMIANLAFMAGLTIGLRDQINYLIPAFPFNLAEDNFYRAAEHGFDATILWPDTSGSQPREYRLDDLASQLLPTAERGLSILGVESEEIVKYLDIIQRRLDKRMTGAIWQVETMAYYFKSCDLEQAQRRMLQDYILEYRMNKPVSEWERPR